MVTDGWTIAASVSSVALVLVTAPSIIFAALQVKAGADATKLTAQQARSSAEAAHIAAQQATISAKAASASALGVISGTSRELQWKVIENEKLQAILTGGSPLTDEMKREAVRGMLINYYAYVYEIRQLDQVPQTSWQAFKSDMTDFFTQPPNKARWEQMRSVYPKGFQEFVDYEVLNRPR